MGTPLPTMLKELNKILGASYNNAKYIAGILSILGELYLKFLYGVILLLIQM